MTRSTEIDIAAGITALIEQVSEKQLNDHQKYVASMRIAEDIRVLVMQLIAESRS
jgi:hypothetical protein